MRKVIVVFILYCKVFAQNNQLPEIMSETPLHPIPENMTYEEYQDMNRRMNIGIGLAFIPIPGIVHRYAGDSNMAKKLTYVTLGGLISIVASSGQEEKYWPDSNYELFIINEGLDNETRYEKIPSEINENGSTTYLLKEMRKKVRYKGGTPALGMIGFAAIFGSYYYDVYHGLKTIYNKREAVRFKYGKKLKYSFRPSFEPLASKTKFNLDLYF